MQCDETMSHIVTAGRSYFRTLRNACVTAGKTTTTAGKIYHGCFEMLSWPHRTSMNIINICFWLLETCTKCSYFIEENTTRRSTVGIWSTSISYAGHEHTVGRRSAVGQVSRQPALDVLQVDRWRGVQKPFEILILVSFTSSPDSYIIEVNISTL